MKDTVISIIIAIAIRFALDIIFKLIYSPSRKVGSVNTMPRDMSKNMHFCSRCGAFLYTKAERRHIHPKDPEWSTYSRVNIKTRAIPIGYLEVSEYSYRCPQCQDLKTYDEQCRIEKIQKTVQRNVLSEQEISYYLPPIISREKKRKAVNAVINKITYIIFLAIAIYIVIKTGEITIIF